MKPLMPPPWWIRRCVPTVSMKSPNPYCIGRALVSFAGVVIAANDDCFTSLPLCSSRVHEAGRPAFVALGAMLDEWHDAAVHGRRQPVRRKQHVVQIFAVRLAGHA